MLAFLKKATKTGGSEGKDDSKGVLPPDKLTAPHLRPASSLGLGVSGLPLSADGMAFDPLQRLLAVSTSDGHIKIFGRLGVEKTVPVPTHTFRPGPTAQLLFVPNRGVLLRISQPGVLDAWDLLEEAGTSGETVRALEPMELHGDKIRCAAALPCAPFVALGCASGGIRFCALVDACGNPVDDGSPARGVKLTQHTVSASNLGAGAEIVEMGAHAVGNVHRLLARSAQGRLAVWDVRSHTLAACLHSGHASLVHYGVVHAACWCPSDERFQFVSGHARGDILVWRLAPLGSRSATSEAFTLACATRVVMEDAGPVRRLLSPAPDCVVALGGGPVDEPMERLALVRLPPCDDDEDSSGSDDDDNFEYGEFGAGARGAPGGALVAAQAVTRLPWLGEVTGLVLCGTPLVTCAPTARALAKAARAAQATLQRRRSQLMQRGSALRGNVEWGGGGDGGECGGEEEREQEQQQEEEQPPAEQQEQFLPGVLQLLEEGHVALQQLPSSSPSCGAVGSSLLSPPHQALSRAPGSAATVCQLAVVPVSRRPGAPRCMLSLSALRALVEMPPTPISTPRGRGDATPGSAGPAMPGVLSSCLHSVAETLACGSIPDPPMDAAAGLLYVCGHRDGCVRLWDVFGEQPCLLGAAPSASAANPTPEGGPPLPLEAVTAVQLTWERGVLVSGHARGQVRVYQFSARLTEGSAVSLSSPHSEGTHARLAEPPGFQLHFASSVHTADVTALSYCADLHGLLSGDAAGVVSLLDLGASVVLWRVSPPCSSPSIPPCPPAISGVRLGTVAPRDAARGARGAAPAEGAAPVNACFYARCDGTLGVLSYAAGAFLAPGCKGPLLATHTGGAAAQQIALPGGSIELLDEAGRPVWMCGDVFTQSSLGAAPPDEDADYDSGTPSGSGGGENPFGAHGDGAGPSEPPPAAHVLHFGGDGGLSVYSAAAVASGKGSPEARAVAGASAGAGSNRGAGGGAHTLLAAAAFHVEGAPGVVVVTQCAGAPNAEPASSGAGLFLSVYALPSLTCTASIPLNGGAGNALFSRAPAAASRAAAAPPPPLACASSLGHVALLAGGGELAVLGAGRGTPRLAQGTELYNWETAGAALEAGTAAQAAQQARDTTAAARAGPLDMVVDDPPSPVASVASSSAWAPPVHGSSRSKVFSKIGNGLGGLTDAAGGALFGVAKGVQTLVRNVEDAAASSLSRQSAAATADSGATDPASSVARYHEQHPGVHAVLVRPAPERARGAAPSPAGAAASGVAPGAAAGAYAPRGAGMSAAAPGGQVPQSSNRPHAQQPSAAAPVRLQYEPPPQASAAPPVRLQYETVKEPEYRFDGISVGGGSTGGAWGGGGAGKGGGRPASPPSPPRVLHVRSASEIKRHYREKAAAAGGDAGTLGKSTDDSKSRASNVHRAAHEAARKLEERGEKLRALDNTAAGLENEAAGFAEMAKRLKEQQQQNPLKFW
ncbi:hypothetical protein FOA52_001284 [Chlamydomonas sp. UWO 241]|nr:hypothetical protein FOA52_001284 [Chlamydomonas sp. UWO 241]